MNNKSGIVSEVVKIVGDTKQAQAVVDCIFSRITEALKKGDDVRLPGFGTFKVSHRKARNGINPRTGEQIKIEEKMVPKFIPARALKDEVT